MIVVATSTSTTVKTSTSSPFSQTFSVTPFLTISSTSTTFSTLQLSSTQGQHGLASAAPIQSSATSTPSSAADGISDTSNDSTGFFIGIGVAIGGEIHSLELLVSDRHSPHMFILSNTLQQAQQ
ncbi:uncharacterized protein LY89DRAFT_687354 [Mollisia scopiformis]|uniref:Uncharacterized protein n=1 Tax=Mollisia scopiformis TaxID=149040 RepID=A0A194X1N3_MOLSC|nr:uncharacterized protein LY89DRAFT_687354 [Mollisia scopiformis]KUJ14106.1 hypothetical protein LY89DRAFT_687354 [Mollisia scopiformis]